MTTTKKLIFLCLSGLILSCSQFQSVNKKSDLDSCYVNRIDSIDNFYLIYVDKNDSLFKIVSQKEMIVNCKKIKVGSKYNFVLRSIRNNAPTIGNIKIVPVNHLDTHCYQFDTNTKICKEDGVHDLYFVDNLKGLCFKEKIVWEQEF